MFVPLSLLYAFSGYTLVCYQITSWMDVVYMFPLIVVGLKKLIDEDKPIMYGVTLFLTICFSFYLSYIMIIFIFLLAFIYIKNNVEKKDQKRAMLSIGIYTILPMLMSLFITYPALRQIFGSARTNISKNIFNNLLGCLFDKLNYFNISILLVVFTMLLIVERKNNKKFLKWYIPALLVLVIPYIVEPLNKVFHFMSYSFFPNRYGFILFYLLVVGGAYFFSANNKNIKNKLDEKLKIILGVVSVILLIGIYFIVFRFVYKDLEVAVYSISMIYAKKAFIILSLLSIVIFGVCFILNIFREEKTYIVLMYIVIISNICFNAFLYIGLRDYQGMIKNSFGILEKVENKESSNYYKLKTDIKNIDDFVVNEGIVSNYQALDHFTSLVSRNSLEFYKGLGYSSFWTMIFSSGGTLFSDSLVSNKYFLTDRDIDSSFYTLKSSDYGYNFYELNYDIGFGYLARNNFKLDKSDTFSYQNKIYESITGNSDLFSVYDISNIKNIDTKNSAKCIIKSNDNYIEYNVSIKEKSILYLDLALTMEESIKGSVSNVMMIYINDELYSDNYPTKTSNGIYDLGVYENQDINIKVKLIKPIDIEKLSIASMDVSKYEEFILNNKTDLGIKFDKNKITIESDVNTAGYLVIPVSYSDNYRVVVNGKSTDTVKMYGGLLGVKVDKGHNQITYTYINKDLEKSLIVSLIATIVFTIISVFYSKVSTNKILGNIAYGTYSLLFYVAGVLYVGIILVWLIKFVI